MQEMLRRFCKEHLILRLGPVYAAYGSNTFTALINDLAKQGLSVLLMTSEMNDLLSLSDRILVMADGKISKEFYRGKVTQEEIFKASVN